MGDGGHEYIITVFSPEGRLYQVGNLSLNKNMLFKQ